MIEEHLTRNWYQQYHAKKGPERNDLRLNPGVLFQVLAVDASVVRALRQVECEPSIATVLDVGCGNGADIYHLLRLHYDPSRITGMDLLSHRVAAARRKYPGIRFVEGDASRMEFPDASFDLVFEAMMFITLTDEGLSRQIAAEMVRVCKQGGYLLLVDYRTPHPTDASYCALTRKRLTRLFGVGSATTLAGVFRGALVPPLGRLLSRWLPSAYFPVAALFPFLVAQVTYLLRKK